MLCLLLGAEPGYDQLLRDGLAALKANSVEEARGALERAVKLKPDGGEAWAGLAEAYNKLGFGVSARTAATRAEGLARGNPAVLRRLAGYYAAGGEPARAADFEERYAAASSGDREALVRAAELRLAAKQPKLAVALALKALAAGDRADLRALLARAYEADGQSAHAINEYNRAILLDPYEEANYFELGQLLMDKENFAAAAQVLEAGRKIFDKSAEITLALGGAYYGLKRYDDAAFAFLKTVTLAPQAPQAYTFLGQLLDQSTKWLPEITTVFASFAEAQPRQYLPQFLYGKALLAGGKELREAEARLRKSIALEDGFWESHYQLGILLEGKPDLNGAAEQLKRSAALARQNPMPHQRLARVYDLMGKPAEAKLERAAAEKTAAAAKAPAETRRTTPARHSPQGR
jgi:Flp pilus assembly protein TadD